MKIEVFYNGLDVSDESRSENYRFFAKNPGLFKETPTSDSGKKYKT